MKANSTSASTSSSTSAKSAASPQGKQMTKKGLDAISLLKQDHRKVEELFTKYQAATSSEAKAQLVRQICSELIVHTKLEEELFYPACREKNVKDAMLDKAQVEHDAAKILITELLSQSPESSYYDAKVMVLSEYIKLHVGEEEKSSDGIFAKAQAAGVDMNALGQHLRTRKEELMAKVAISDLSPPKPRSLTSSVKQSELSGDQTMARQYNQDRDEQGRFMNDDRSSRSDYSSQSRQSRSRYDNENDYDRGRSSRDQSNERERDDQGRFVSDRDYDDDNRRGSSYSRSDRDDDYRSSGRGHGGWYGDSEGHSRASEKGWEGRGGSNQGRDYDNDNRRGSSYSRSDRDDDYRSSGRGHGGWYGDSEGHSRASEKGWEGRDRSNQDRDYGDDDNRRGSSSYSRSDRDDDDRSSGHGGWRGDPQGHAEAARRGWRNRQ